ncbi:uncharacterized protein ACWYII_004539 isoform 2-T4 [Salvelinus alpinus]
MRLSNTAGWALRCSTLERCATLERISHSRTSLSVLKLKIHQMAQELRSRHADFNITSTSTARHQGNSTHDNELPQPRPTGASDRETPLNVFNIPRLCCQQTSPKQNPPGSRMSVQLIS